MTTFKGTPEEIGTAYGVLFADRIRHNLSELVRRENYEPPTREQRWELLSVAEGDG